MKVRIEDVWNCDFCQEGDKYKEITFEIKRAGLPVLEELNERGCINIYTEINTLDDINRLVKEFGCHIVYGDTNEDGYTIIEKYDSYRE